MKQILIVMAAAMTVAVDFVVYCCLRLASQEDQMIEKLSRRRRKENF